MDPDPPFDTTLLVPSPLLVPAPVCIRLRIFPGQKAAGSGSRKNRTHNSSSELKHAHAAAADHNKHQSEVDALRDALHCHAATVAGPMMSHGPHGFNSAAAIACFCRPAFLIRSVHPAIQPLAKLLRHPARPEVAAPFE